ncbi:MAG TPA: hypothetical protein VFC65_13220 [Prolixibacteraceae bacterium]|nr:hypothetical protein [Prolixibacteraceae bacterium]
MKQIIKITLVLLIALITGCYYDSEEKLYPVVSSTCDLTNVTFAGTVKPILQASCLNCHSNSKASNDGGGVRLENYDDVKVSVLNGKLMGTINHSSGYIAMPNGGGKLIVCEINQLQNWIDNGTLNN